MSLGRSEDRLEQVLRQKANDRNCHPVPCKVVALIVCARQLVVVRKSHEPCGLPRADQARPDTGAVHDHDRLPGRPSRRCAQAARDLVEAHFRSYSFAVRILRSRPLVDGPHHAAPGPLRGLKLRDIHRRHLGDQPRGLFRGVPFDARGIFFDEVGEACVADRRRRKIPPQPPLPRLCRNPCDRVLKAAGMEGRHRLRR